MQDLSQCQAVVILFAMEGCPACEEYKPRFESQVEAAQKQGIPFVFYDNRTKLARGQIPVLILNSESEDSTLQALGDLYGVQGLPTTLLLTWGGYLKKEGAISNNEIDALLATAATA